MGTLVTTTTPGLNTGVADRFPSASLRHRGVAVTQARGRKDVVVRKSLLEECAGKRRAMIDDLWPQLIVRVQRTMLLAGLNAIARMHFFANTLESVKAIA